MSDLPTVPQIRHAMRDAQLSHLDRAQPMFAEQIAGWLGMLLTQPRNLTSLRDPQAVISKHVIEPLRAWTRLYDADLPIPHGDMIDLGSGNGAPGLPIALSEPSRETLLLDSREGATDFLREVTRQLQVKHVTVSNGRAEVEARGPIREQFAIALTRAMAPPAMALELTIPFLEIGGIGVLWIGTLGTGDDAAAERQRLGNVSEQLGAELTPLDGDADLWVVTKLRPSAAQYPRSWTQIRRRPLT